MKKIILFISLIFLSLVGISQVKNTQVLNIDNATTKFGKNLPKATEILDLNTGDKYYLSQSVDSTYTITTAPGIVKINYVSYDSTLYNYLAYGTEYMGNFREKILQDGADYYVNDFGYTIAKLKQNNLLNKAVALFVPAATDSGVLQFVKPYGLKFNSSRNTPRYRLNSDGIYQSVPVNTAAIDYSSGFPSLNGEPERLRLNENPTELGHSYWSKSGASIQGDPSTAEAEEVTNGDFATWNGAAQPNDFPTGWVLIGNTATAYVENSNGVHFVSDDAGLRIRQTSLTSGAFYKFDYEITQSTSGTLRIVGGATSYTLETTVGTYSLYFEADGTTIDIRCLNVPCDISIDNVSTKKVTGYEAIMYKIGTDTLMKKAWKLVEDGTTAVHYVSTGVISATDATKYTSSFYAKAGERTWVAALAGGVGYSYFDLSNGVVGTETGGCVGSITALSNGWYKCTSTYTTVTTSTEFRVFLADADNSVTYTGTAGKGVFIFFPQVEQGTYSTSPIWDGTAAGTVTRVADAIDIDDLQTNNILGSTEWTMVFDLNCPIFTGSSKLISFKNTTGGEEFGLYNESGGLNLYFNDATSYLGKDVSTSRQKLLLRNSNKTFSVYIDGTLIETSTLTISDQSINRILISPESIGLDVFNITFFNSALSDSDCEKASTLSN